MLCDGGAGARGCWASVSVEFVLPHSEQAPDHFLALKRKNMSEVSDPVFIHFVPCFQKSMRQFSLGEENTVIHSPCIFPIVRFALRRKNRVSVMVLFH